MLTVLFLLTALAEGPPVPAQPVDVLEAVGSAQVNWTQGTVLTTKSWAGTGVDASRKTSEHEARRHLGESLSHGVSDVRVTASDDVRTLSEDPVLGDRLEQRATRWAVSEARYFASGRVELVGELSLVELLAPWSLARAVDTPPTSTTSVYTGLVLDARGTGAVAAFAPLVLSSGGKVLWDGALSRSAATKLMPVIYVTEPSHPAATRAGESPMVLLVASAKGPDLTLSSEASARFRAGLREVRPLREGTVVVVVDP